MQSGARPSDRREEPPVSIAQTPLRRLSPSGVSWRPLGGTLWVGRTDAGPVGTIEGGRRFVVTDVDGRAWGAFRSLEAAMAALEARAPVGEPLAARSWEALALVCTLSGAAAA